MNNTLTIADIIDEVYDQTDRTRDEARKYVESLLAHHADRHRAR